MQSLSKSASARRPVILARTVRVPADAAHSLLVTDPAAFVGASPPASDETGRRRIGIRLLGDVKVQRKVKIGFGPVIEEDDGTLVLPVWWEAAEHPSLFPTFDGGLEVGESGHATELRLVGSCQPPLGRFGAFADDIAGYRVARATLEAFLEEVATRVADRHREPSPSG